MIGGIRRIIPRRWKRRIVSFRRSLIMLDPFNNADYKKWIRSVDNATASVKLEYRPLISVLIPVYNAKGEYLRECIDSVLEQSYDNFEMCIVDDASTNKDTLEVLKAYGDNKRIRIKRREKNGHISRASNDALEMAKGEFIALVDNDDVLAKDALYKMVEALNKNKKLDLIYSDEDKINKYGMRCCPHFKPDWSPDTLLSLNFICHLMVARTKLVREVGGFTVGMEGAQDYDLVLKLTEKTNRIYHIPEILYHWRMIKGSTALRLDNKQYASDKGKLAIEKALKRRKIDAEVQKDPISSYYRVIYRVKKEPKVSIIIPTRDYAELTKKCLESIYKKTTYENYEIIVVNNGSKEEKTFELFKRYKKTHNNFRVVDANMEFNYSIINNLAVREAKGEIIVLLNNDIEVITPEWLSLMVGYAIQPHVGAVGAKLLYPDNTIQHGGVVLGMGGVAGHIFLNEERGANLMFGRTRVPYDIGAVTAACLCVEKKKYEEVGGLEEDLKVAFNDIDFNMKLLKKGYYNVILSMVELYHYESKSRGTDMAQEKKERFQSEVLYMKSKWGDDLVNDKCYNANYSLEGPFMLDKRNKK